MAKYKKSPSIRRTPFIFPEYLPVGVFPPHEVIVIEHPAVDGEASSGGVLDSLDEEELRFLPVFSLHPADHASAVGRGFLFQEVRQFIQCLVLIHILFLIRDDHAVVLVAIFVIVVDVDVDQAVPVVIYGRVEQRLVVLVEPEHLLHLLLVHKVLVPMLGPGIMGQFPEVVEGDVVTGLPVQNLAKEQIHLLGDLPVDVVPAVRLVFRGLHDGQAVMGEGVTAVLAVTDGGFKYILRGVLLGVFLDG